MSHTPLPSHQDHIHADIQQLNIQSDIQKLFLTVDQLTTDLKALTQDVHQLQQVALRNFEVNRLVIQQILEQNGGRAGVKQRVRADAA